MHEVVHVSDDLKHDAHLVCRFHDVTMNVLRKCKIPIRKIIQFTDQAPSQYKNKSAFRYAAHCDLLTMLNFFGVRHGKGPCDACAGRVKQQISSLVKTEEVTINSAREFFDACKDHLETRHTEGCVHFYKHLNLLIKLQTGPTPRNGPQFLTLEKSIALQMFPKKGSQTSGISYAVAMAVYMVTVHVPMKCALIGGELMICKKRSLCPQRCGYGMCV